MPITGRSENFTGRIRLGMVGGGQGAFIGAVHRIASRIDDQYELVAGALSSEPERAKASGLELGLREDRSYGSFEEMARREARLKDGIEAVAIVTPNHMHFPVAKAFLQRGIHVICDKPLTANAARGEEARRAGAQVRQGLRAHAQLHRLSDGPAGARDGRGRRARRDPPRARRVRAGLADDRRRDDRPEAGGLAHRSGALRRRRRGRRHRHARLQPRLLRLGHRGRDDLGRSHRAS